MDLIEHILESPNYVNSVGKAAYEVSVNIYAMEARLIIILPTCKLHYFNPHITNQSRKISWCSVLEL